MSDDKSYLYKCYKTGRVAVFGASIKTLRFLLSQHVCARAIFFYTESLQQPMDLLVSSKFVSSQIDVLSFSDYPYPVPLTVPNPCLLSFA